MLMAILSLAQPVEPLHVEKIHVPIQQMGIFTAYSCNSKVKMTKAEILMNCPSKLKHKEGRTADGSRPVVGRTLACSEELMGKLIYVPHIDKTLLCEDTGGAIKGNKFDIYVENIQAAREFGIRKLIYKVL